MDDADAGDQPELFPVTIRGRAEDTMARQIEAWSTAGRAVSLVQRQTLLDQAHAVDLAVRARRPTSITSAHRVMLELLQGFGLAGDSPPPAGDPLDRFLADVIAAGATDGTVADAG